MKVNWLSSMLTKAKQKSTLWVTLADTIQATFEAHLGSIEKTIVNNRSIMTMSVEEIKRKQESLGHFFSVLDVPDTEKGLTLQHRLDQIHLKSTEFPIKDMVRRNFDGLEMEWSPVYAPINQELHPYGSKFVAQTEFDTFSQEQQDLYFMTSRGRMVLNLNKYLPPEEEMQRIYNTIAETIVPMIPLDIVFDGFFTQVQIKAVFNIHFYSKSTQGIRDNFAVSYTLESIADQDESLESKFDIQDDAFSVDSTTRAMRLPVQNRTYESLGEQPLGLMPLGASYLHDAHLTGAGMNEAKLPIGGNWKSTSGIAIPSTNSFSIMPIPATMYHILNCEVGKRYSVKARKGSNSRLRLVISQSNTIGGEISPVFKEADLQGDYGLTFTATSIAMYLVAKLDSESQNIASQIEVNKLTVI